MKYSLLENFQDSGLILIKYIVERDFKDAKRFCGDELISAGVQGLIKACKDYSEGFGFKNFACANIKRAIIDHIRKERHWNRRKKCSGKKVFFYHELLIDSMPRFSFHDFEDVDDSCDIDFMLDKLNTLPEIYRKIIYTYYFKEISFDNMKEELGIPKSRMYKVRNQGFNFLRRSLC